MPSGLNKPMESLFTSLKTERTAGELYRTRQEARVDVFEYIERYDHLTRPHPTNGHVSPVEFDKAL